MLIVVKRLYGAAETILTHPALDSRNRPSDARDKSIDNARTFERRDPDFIYKAA